MSCDWTVCAPRKAAIRDVDLRNEARCSRSARRESSDWRAVSRWLPNGAAGNSGGADRDGPAHRRRAAGRLLYRPALLQTRLQVLGLRQATRPTVELRTIGDAE